MRLLLVDDEPDFVQPLAERLSLRGFTALVARDAAEALDIAARERPSLIFLDVHLPDMDGVSLLQLLRERSPDTDVVMLSGATEVATAVKAMRRGAVNWLAKPVDMDALLEECRRAGERRTTREKEARLADTAMLGTLGRVAEGVAHEVNNPVNIMMQAAGWIGDLLEPHALPEAEEIREALSLIRTQSLRVRELTRRLLICGKGLDPGTAPVDVAAVVRETLDLLDGRIRGQGVRVETVLPPDLPRPPGSALELRQICAHLLENSLDAMPGGGLLRVTGRAVPAEDDGVAWYELSVLDTGEGIPEDVLPQIFEPFFTTRRVGKGAGLGLAVCRSLVQRRNGVIEARSPFLAEPPGLPAGSEEAAPMGKGSGSLFTVRLPLRAEPTSPADTRPTG